MLDRLLIEVGFGLSAHQVQHSGPGAERRWISVGSILPLEVKVVETFAAIETLVHLILLLFLVDWLALGLQEF